MKTFRVLAVFVVYIVINSTFTASYHSKHSSGNAKLVKSICETINDVVRTNSETKDIMIANLGSKVWSATLNDIMQCINDDNPVLLTDFHAVTKDKSLRKASIVILAFYRLDMNLIRSIIRNNHFSSVWHHMARIICMMPKPINLNLAAQSLQVFTNSGFLNVAFVTNDAQYMIIRSMTMEIVLLLSPENGHVVFPDKLNNMNGSSYLIALYHQPPRIIILKFISAPMLYFFHALRKVQNASFKLNVLKNTSMLGPLWVQRKMHLTLNTASILDTPEPKLMTYEEKGYCAFIPIPPKVSLAKVIFIKPFDALTWIILLSSIVFSTLVWYMFRNYGAVDSAWLFLYGSFVYFIGQGINFSRKNHIVLVIFIQLNILMMWILSNAYEGVITSFMIDPISENRLQTVKDLLDSDYEIITDEAFAFTVRHYEEFQAIKSRVNTSGLKMTGRQNEIILQQKYVLIKSCEIIEDELSFTLPNQRYYVDYYYILPEKIITQFVELEASYMNPFLERLQYYMDLSFQAGLMKMWITFSYRDFFHKPENESHDVTYIHLNDLYQVFSILLIGYGLAAIVFLIEVFFYDCLKDLNLCFQACRLRNRVHQMAYKKRRPKDPKYQRGALYYIIHRHRKVKRLQRGRLKVRKIIVQPRNQVY
ncbi:unnamed protein product [Chironomus riparius]|uniref:Ionotropic receptor n=1 Tax=Chironomus riparius TaxID=315576 RepID=A0A9N9RXL8_9DIPT|nr:unnamed protein product [Chironomus riparius]